MLTFWHIIQDKYKRTAEYIECVTKAKLKLS